MKNYIQELNELFGPTLASIENDLNKWSFDNPRLEKAPGNIYHVPKIQSIGNYMLIPKTEDVFNLDPPVAGVIKDTHQTDDTLENGIIIRRIIGYSYSLRALEKKDPTLIKLVAKEMIETLKKAKGYGPDKANLGFYGKFERVGLPGSYFSELDSYAGFEIRLYSHCHLAEDIK